MSDPSPSTEWDPLTTNNDHGQPSGPARAPGGSRTPRRVQWASAVEEDDRDHGSEEVSNHELDEAGLDVCCFSLFLTFSYFPLHSQLPSERSLMLSNVIAQIPIRLF
jgi:hypothetical protein